MRDVAKLAGASVAAVSATLSENRSGSIRVSAPTRDRIRHAATQLGYVSNPIAKSLATGRTGVIGLMLPYVDAYFGEDPFSMTVMRGVMRGAVESHLNVMVYSAFEGVPESKTAMMIDSRVDGLVLVMPTESGAVITKLVTRGVPFVSLLRRPVPDAWVVNSSDEEGGALAARHLLSLGHRHLLHLQGDLSVLTSRPRCQGFVAECQAAGARVEVLEAGFDWKHGRSVGLKRFGSGAGDFPTAVFCANDSCAHGLLMALDEIGLRVPEQVAVVGYDDTSMAETTRPRLTSVHMGVEEMGFLALQKLVQLIQNPKAKPVQLSLPVRLTVRESCGANASARALSALKPNDTKRSIFP